MRIGSAALAGALTFIVCIPFDGGGQGRSDPRGGGPMETRIWFDRGLDPIFDPGDRARVYYRASRDAYIALFHLDTDGGLQLLYPSVSAPQQRVRGGQDYRLLFTESDDWQVEEAPGLGYFFALASDSPFDFSGTGQAAAPSAEWAILAAIGTSVRQDPYLVLDAITQALAPGRSQGSLAVDLSLYHVGEAYSFPRFLCYNCHAAEAFDRWDPYQRACPSYRVVIYNDPYFYAVSRYQGSRSLFTLPPNPGSAQFAFRDRSPGESGSPLVQARGPAPGPAAATFLGQGRSPAAPNAALPPSPGDAPSTRLPSSALPTRPDADPPQDRPVLERRSTETRDPPPR